MNQSPFLKTPLSKLGLCLAYKMEKMLRPGTWDLTLFEKNPHLGGTWYENTWVPFEASTVLALTMAQLSGCGM